MLLHILASYFLWNMFVVCAKTSLGEIPDLPCYEIIMLSSCHWVHSRSVICTNEPNPQFTLNAMNLFLQYFVSVFRGVA